MLISIGSDHAGYKLKEEIKLFLSSLNIQFKDCGTFSEDSVDYPDFGHAVANDIVNKQADFGIVICGSGNGINISANKHKGIRSALCWNEQIAKLARLHNDANILALPGRFIDVDEAKRAVKTFIDTPFEGGRHQNRINKIEISC
ncbi:MAG: ribose 5-phosphate isomerase B [Bacteroidia bacterium]